MPLESAWLEVNVLGVEIPVEKLPETPEPPQPLHMPVHTASVPRGRKDWIERNIAPIMVFATAVLLLLFSAQVGRVLHGDKQLGEGIKSEKPVLDLANLPNEVLAESPVVLFSGLLKLISAAATLGLLAWWIVDREGLQRASNRLPGSSPRYRPAVRVIDIGVSWVFGVACGSALMLVAIPRIGLASGELMALQIALGSVGLLGGCAALCGLAKWRAGGLHGMAGLLPFWTLPKAATPRPLWHDIGLGLIAYVLINAVLLVAGEINKAAVDLLGAPPDQHPLINDLMQQQPLWVVATIFLAATVGAAFTEELIFRGALYNACQRHFSKLPAALLAAGLFSAVHFIKSDFLGLFVLGLAMTWLYERTGRLVASMTFHFVNNAVSILMILSLRELIAK